MTANILEQFKIGNYEFQDPDHRKQYLDMYRKLEVTAKGRTFEQLNDDVNFLTLMSEFLLLIVSLYESEQNWNHDRLLQWIIDELEVRPDEAERVLRVNFYFISDKIIGRNNFIKFDAPELRMLPPQFSPLGIVKIRGCKNFETLSSFLKIKDDCVLESLPSLRRINSKLISGRDMIVHSCGALGYIAGELHIKGDIQLINCPQLERITASLYVYKDFKIENCPKLTDISSINVNIKGTLIIKGPVTQQLKDRVEELKKLGKIGDVQYDS
ncbi:hypothetical protein COT97_00960 [Candidatus Falkowbacteria bacterium CG10_big_fil_rev_8_21_14_0_10_39_11]|uniref:Uncharacterized protein n=1 Tax=Candidatus Falkowbacteria bacterium CG10_big_fil_rev_8_21_14_0_10_39_11 TaxID=1974565 RepID=A0A2H0V7Z3_9BACT|nr:MAG: hypothetical protein COT97_00960 [Candidatus Falkowbacteria bacterium CG10_big_fil_rev_8_21_14_0_10_39_11]